VVTTLLFQVIKTRTDKIALHKQEHSLN